MKREKNQNISCFIKNFLKKNIPNYAYLKKKKVKKTSQIFFYYRKHCIRN